MFQQDGILHILGLSIHLNLNKIFQILEKQELDYGDYFAEDEHGKKRIGPPRNSNWKNVEVFIIFF